jgi:hypothetical protein
MDVAEASSCVQSALENLGSDCPMEEVAGLCPELTWNQVFLAVDYLSRTGQVRMRLAHGRSYMIRALHAVEPVGSVTHSASQ